MGYDFVAQFTPLRVVCFTLGMVLTQGAWRQASALNALRTLWPVLAKAELSTQPNHRSQRRKRKEHEIALKVERTFPLSVCVFVRRALICFVGVLFCNNIWKRKATVPGYRSQTQNGNTNSHSFFLLLLSLPPHHPPPFSSCPFSTGREVIWPRQPF